MTLVPKHPAELGVSATLELPKYGRRGGVGRRARSARALSTGGQSSAQGVLSAGGQGREGPRSLNTWVQERRRPCVR